MEKELFDENFKKIVENGSRRELAAYRNCIIEEERRRYLHLDLNSVKDMYVDTMEDAKSCRKIAFFFATASGLFAVASAVLIISVVKKGLLLVTIMLGLSLLINVANTLKFVQMVGYYNMIYREFKKGRVTIITKKSSSEMSYPEIFNVIAEDTIETLKSKKEKLDELLGL